MWVQLHVPRIEDGNNFGVAVQVGQSKPRVSRDRRETVHKMKVCPRPTGESVRAADQHAHQGRGVPDSDFKVRGSRLVCVPGEIEFGR